MRKPILLIDDASDSLEAIRLFKQSGQVYVEYHIRNFEESCCGELPTTRAPSVFAPEGVFKGLEGIKDYLAIEKLPDTGESAYW
jgi:hypothetical protein